MSQNLSDSQVRLKRDLALLSVRSLSARSQAMRASLASAQTSSIWLAGSFNGSTWTKALLVAAGMAILIPVALMLSRPLGALMLGDELATGLGVRTGARKRQLIAVGVITVAVAVAVAGPISFVALAAPQLAKFATRYTDAGFASSALMGAILVLGSDIVAQRIFASTQLPVGVVTGTLGGMYLIWLLAYQWGRTR